MHAISKKILIVLLFLTISIIFFHPTNELSLDLGEHLLLGKLILQTHTIPTTNLLSYTNPSFTYVNYEWLVDIVYSIIYKYFAINGLIILTTVVCLSAVSFIFFSLLRKSRFFIVAYALLLYLGIFSERTYVRPEVFSYLLLSFYIILLYKFREKYTKLIFLLIPLSFLWINIHIYFLVGILLIGLFLLEGIILINRKFSKKYIVTLLFVFLSSIVVSLVNPYGIKGLLFPLSLPNTYAYPVQENFDIFTVQSWHPNSIVFSILVFEIASVILILSLLINRRKARLVDWFLAITFTVAAMDAIRNFPLFMFATFIAFSSNVGDLFEKVAPHVRKKVEQIERHLFLLSSLIFILILVWYITFLVPTQGFGFGTDHRGQAGVDFFITNNLTGPIFNDYDIGSYLAYRLYPRERVFVDGRPEAYPASFFQNIYIPMQQQKDLFSTEDRKYHFNVIVFSTTDQRPEATQFLKSISADSNWKLIYLDSYVVIFVKNISKNKTIIEKYQMSDSTYIIPNTTSTLDLDIIAYFLGNIGWINASIRTYENVLSINPKDCVALNNISVSNFSNDIVSKYELFYKQYCQQ